MVAVDGTVVATALPARYGAIAVKQRRGLACGGANGGMIAINIADAPAPDLDEAIAEMNAWRGVIEAAVKALVTPAVFAASRLHGAIRTIDHRNICRRITVQSRHGEMLAIDVA